MTSPHFRRVLTHAFSTWRSRRSVLAGQQALIDEREAQFAAELDQMAYAGSTSAALSTRAAVQARLIERMCLARDGDGEWPDLPAAWVPRTAGERLGSVLEPLSFALLFGFVLNLLQSSWSLTALFMIMAVASFLAGIWLQAGPLPAPAFARVRLSALAERRP